MAWDKKAQSEDVFWFAFFYFPLTMGVVIALVVTPTMLMSQSLQPVPLDEAILARQIHSRLWKTDLMTGKTSPFEYTGDLKGIDKTLTDRQMAYSVSIDAKEAYYRKEYYELARPIAPFRYNPYTERRLIDVGGTKKVLKIEEYQPHKYAVQPT